MKRIALFTLLLLSSGLAAAQQSGAASLKDRMSPEQFKAAGLNKLSDSELKQLNAWFNGEKTVVVEKTVIVEKPAEIGMAAKKQDTSDINSRLVGEFRGWRGNTVFTLENGQIWEQADRSEMFASKSLNPKVKVLYSGFSGWKMQVEGYNTLVKVKRVK
jgi:hypothetical protein